MLNTDSDNKSAKIVPVSIIKRIVDEYAVAYLNSHVGGSIFWGIRDADGIVIGVELGRESRDNLNRVVCEKIKAISPRVYEEMYDFFYHPVYQNGIPVQDLYVIELQITPPKSHQGPYFTASGKCYEKTLAGIREIPPDELADWKENYRLKHCDE